MHLAPRVITILLHCRVFNKEIMRPVTKQESVPHAGGKKDQPRENIPDAAQILDLVSTNLKSAITNVF